MSYFVNPPKECDICHDPITEVFVDGKTNMGPWANMCDSCHNRVGLGLGTGLGQRYEKQGEKFFKVGG